MRALLPLLSSTMLLLTACPEAGTGECAGPADCGAVDEAPCPACAPLASSLCLDGACTERPADDVDVAITFSLDRAIDQDALGLVWAVAAQDRSCADVGSFTSLPADLNAFASGQKTLSGGGFHPDEPLGRAPAGDVLVLMLATREAAGAGAVLGSGCAEGDAAALPALTIAP